MKLLDEVNYRIGSDKLITMDQLPLNSHKQHLSVNLSDKQVMPRQADVKPSKPAVKTTDIEIGNTSNEITTSTTSETTSFTVN